MGANDLAALREPEVAAGTRALDLLMLDEIRMGAWERVLFVECGDGWVVEEAWRRMVRGYACGVDTTAPLIELANRLRAVPGKLEFRQWDGRVLSWPDGTFDRVVARFAVAHCPDPAAALREIYRVLRAGGSAYFLEAAGAPPAAPDCGAAVRGALERCGFVAREAPWVADATVLLRADRTAA